MEALGLTEVASGCAEVVGIAHYVVSQVDGGRGGSVDSQALIEPPPHLEGEQAEHKQEGGGGAAGGDRGPALRAGEVQEGDDRGRHRLVQQVVPGCQAKGEWYIQATEDVEVGEVTLVQGDQSHQLVLSWTIQSFAIPIQM